MVGIRLHNTYASQIELFRGKPGCCPVCDITNLRACPMPRMHEKMNSSKPTLPPKIQIALETTVGLKDVDKKWDALAGSLGMTAGVLRNKVASANEDKRHHLSLAEAIVIVKASKDHGLIHAI